MCPRATSSFQVAIPSPNPEINLLILTQSNNSGNRTPKPHRFNLSNLRSPITHTGPVLSAVIVVAINPSLPVKCQMHHARASPYHNLGIREGPLLPFTHGCGAAPFHTRMALDPLPLDLASSGATSVGSVNAESRSGYCCNLIELYRFPLVSFATKLHARSLVGSLRATRRRRGIWAIFNYTRSRARSRKIETGGRDATSNDER